MMSLRGLGPLTRAYLLQAFRSRTAIFWNVAFPLLWLFLFGFVFFRGADKSLMMPGLFTITILSSSFFGVSYTMVAEREQGILRRYRVTPVSALVIVLANSIRAVVMMAVSVGIQGSVGWLVFRYQIHGSLLVLALSMLLGAAALVPLGLFVGSVAQDMRSAPAIGNLLFFPLIFGSGAAYPYSILPDWMQRVGRLLPTSYLVELLQGVMVRGQGIMQLRGPIAVLLVTLVFGAWVNSLLFRWESDDPVNPRHVLLAIGGLLLVLAAAALLSPAFQMAQSQTG